MKVSVTVDVTDERISDLLTSALEGGSNYWYYIDVKRSTKPKSLGVEFWSDVPLHKEGFIYFGVHDDDVPRRYRLDRAILSKGMQVMASKYPKYWANFMGENDDADTGDVFLQCCLFQEVLFG